MAQQAEDVKVPEETDSPDRMGVVEGAQEIEGLLSGSAEGGAAEEAGESREDDPAPETETVEDADVEEVEEAPEAEAEPADEGDDLGESQHEETEEPDEDSELDLSQTVAVQVDGEEQEVTLDELRGGYMREAAFTRKTQELADQRREVQQEAERLQAGQQEYAQRLEVVEKVMEAVQPEKPDPELRKADPQTYAEQMEAYEERQEQIEAVQAERQEALRQLQEQQAQVQQAKLEEERELLESAIPELVDPDQREDLMGQMVKTAQSTYGFTEEELSNVVDHRAIHMLHDAMRYHELVEQGKQVTETKKEKPAKKMKPGSSTPSKEKDTGSSDALKRLARSGSVNDAAEVLEGML